MSYTVIDSDNYAASGIQTFFFPGGEPHVKVPKFDGRLLLFLKLRTWNDVGIALALTSALNVQDDVIVDALIPYFPGARQDRTDGHSPFTLSMMANMFEDSFVHVFDLHSEVLAQCFEEVWIPSDLHITTFPQFDGVIVPDRGARARAADFLAAYAPSAELIQCDKVREFSTGKITGYQMPPLPKAGRYIIVDDICDGGATFNMLAAEFKHAAYGPSSTLELWVSHGIFSRGVSNLDPAISRIYTTDSFYHPSKFFVLDDEALKDNPRVTVFPLAPLFDKIMGELNDLCQGQ